MADLKVARLYDLRIHHISVINFNFRMGLGYETRPFAGFLNQLNFYSWIAIVQFFNQTYANITASSNHHPMDALGFITKRYQNAVHMRFVTNTIDVVAS